MVSIHKCGASSWVHATLLQGTGEGGTIFGQCRMERTFKCPLPPSHREHVPEVCKPSASEVNVFLE